MVNRFKINLLVLIAAITFVTAALATPVHLIRKKFNTSLDYSCCKEGQLFIHHYYTQTVLGFRLSEGFLLEKVGEKATNGCNIQCSED